MKKLATIIAVSALVLSGAFAELRISKNAGEGVKAVEIALGSQSVVVAEGGTGTNGYGSVSLYTFEPGSITLLGAIADLKLTYPTNQVNNASGIDLSVGTTQNADGDLSDSNEANVVSSMGVDPFTNGVSSIQGGMSSPVILDGTSTAITLYVNTLVDDADISAVSTGSITGTITVQYLENGDY